MNEVIGKLALRVGDGTYRIIDKKTGVKSIKKQIFSKARNKTQVPYYFDPVIHVDVDSSSLGDDDLEPGREVLEMFVDECCQSVTMIRSVVLSLAETINQDPETR